MNTLVLGARTVRSRPLPAILTVLLLALGIATVIVVLLFQRELQDRIGRDARGIDLVVGAKGSGLQLVLSAVFHADVPTGNVPLPELRAIARHPMVAGVIPLSLGDAYRGFRIVGTTGDYVNHYGGRLAQGRLWERSMEAVAGSRAARDAGLRAGASFVGAHGLEGDSGFRHGENPYRVVGVLEETGTVLDRLILVDSASVWEVHAVHGATGTAAAADMQRDDPDGRRHRDGHDGGERRSGQVDESGDSGEAGESVGSRESGASEEARGTGMAGAATAGGGQPGLPAGDGEITALPEAPAPAYSALPRRTSLRLGPASLPEGRRGSSAATRSAGSRCASPPLRADT